MFKAVDGVILFLALIAGAGSAWAQTNSKIVHDSEYYILEAQNGQVWAVEDGDLDKKLAELRKKYGTPPNIIHYMWDDQPPMSFGDPIYQKIRGYDTPNLNKLARDGEMVPRKYRTIAILMASVESVRWPLSAAMRRRKNLS